MIEILIIIAVVKMFTKQAESKGLNKNLWGFIGAASYYLPILLFTFVIMPELIMSGVLDFSTETEIRVAAVLMNLAIGIICCIIAYQILKSRPTQIEEDSEVLDTL